MKDRGNWVTIGVKEGSTREEALEKQLEELQDSLIDRVKDIRQDSFSTPSQIIEDKSKIELSVEPVSQPEIYTKNVEITEEDPIAPEYEIK